MIKLDKVIRCCLKKTKQNKLWSIFKLKVLPNQDSV